MTMLLFCINEKHYGKIERNKLGRKVYKISFLQ